MFRWWALTTLVACLSISTYCRRRARKEGETIPRKREKPLWLLARALVALPLLGAVLAYVVNPPWMAWASFATPLWSRWLGVGIGLLTVPSVLWVFRSLGSNVSETVLTKENHKLVTNGAYRWIRHPLYTTGIALILAIGLMAANWFILLFGLITLLAVRLVVIPTEERALLAKFGGMYQEYMQRAGRLLPRLPVRR